MHISTGSGARAGLQDPPRTPPLGCLGGPMEAPPSYLPAEVSELDVLSAGLCGMMCRAIVSIIVGASEPSLRYLISI